MRLAIFLLALLVGAPAFAQTQVIISTTNAQAQIQFGFSGSNQFNGKFIGDGSGLTNVSGQGGAATNLWWAAQGTNVAITTNFNNTLITFNAQTDTNIVQALINSLSYASNVQSGGQLPAGTVAANSGFNGGLLVSSNGVRVWSRNGGLLTNLQGANVVGAIPIGVLPLPVAQLATNYIASTVTNALGQQIANPIMGIFAGANLSATTNNNIVSISAIGGGGSGPITNNVIATGSVGFTNNLWIGPGYLAYTNADGNYIISTNGVLLVSGNLASSYNGLARGLTNSGGYYLSNAIFGIIQTGATTNNGVVTLAATGGGSGLPGTNTTVAYGSASETNWLAVLSGYDFLATNTLGGYIQASNGDLYMSGNLTASNLTLQSLTTTNLFTGITNAPVLGTGPNGTFITNNITAGANVTVTPTQNSSGGTNFVIAAAGASGTSNTNVPVLGTGANGQFITNGIVAGANVTVTPTQNASGGTNFVIASTASGTGSSNIVDSSYTAQIRNLEVLTNAQFDLVNNGSVSYPSVVPVLMSFGDWNTNMTLRLGLNTNGTLIRATNNGVAGATFSLDTNMNITTFGSYTNTGSLASIKSTYDVQAGHYMYAQVFNGNLQGNASSAATLSGGASGSMLTLTGPLTLSNTPVTDPILISTNFGQTAASFSGNTNSFFQVLAVNYNTGTNASADFVAQANNGNDGSFYIDMGINNQNWNNPGNIGYTNDGYLYLQGGSNSPSLWIGTINTNTAQNGGSVRFFVGNSTNTVLTLNTNAIAVSNASLSITSGLLSGNGGGLSNLNANTLTGGVCIVQWEASGIKVGATLPATYVTNTPGTASTAVQSAGLPFVGWQISTSATNNLIGQVSIPFNYGGGPVNCEVTVYSGTNFSTKVTNVWSFAASTVGAALGTAVTVTNNLPITTGTCQTNFQTGGVTIGGTPKAGLTMNYQVSSWAGSPFWTSTNTELVTEIKMWFPTTNAQQSAITIP